MIIRERRDEDLPSCVALLRSVYEASGYPARWPPDPVAWLAGVSQETAWVAERGPEDQVTVGATNGPAEAVPEIIGHVAMRRGDHYRVWPAWREATGVPDDRLAVLCRLFVSPTAQARGIGSALIQQVSAHAAAEGLELVLDADRANHGVLDYYDRRGWRRVGEDVLTLEDGRPLPLVLYLAPHRGVSDHQPSAEVDNASRR